jgi:multiple antibiotic resistance protein
VHDLLKEPITFFIYAFTSIFVIVNPVGGILTFMSLTNGMSNEERKQTAKRAVAVACILAIVFAIGGELILRLFNITVDSLRVAGGVLLFMVAIDMLQARTSRESVTPEEMRDATRRSDISVFPLATPLLTGPGAITTVIVVIRTGKAIELKIITLLTIVLIFIIAYFIFRSADKINKLLGVTVSLAITRIMGLILGAISVHFISEGSWNIYRSLAAVQ